MLPTFRPKHTLLPCLLAVGWMARADPIYVESPVLIDFKNIRSDGGGEVANGRLPVGEVFGDQPSVGSNEIVIDKQADETTIKSVKRIRKSKDVNRIGQKRVFSNCEDFAFVGRFDPQQLVANTWFPFFFWADFNVVPFTHLNFSLPTEKLLAHYTQYYKHLTSVDWEPAKLVMRDGAEEFLLISADGQGLFNVIRDIEGIELRERRAGFTLPQKQFRLKIVKGYLLVINCNQNLAIATAPIYGLPRDAQSKVIAAMSTGFKGHGRTVDYGPEQSKASQEYSRVRQGRRSRISK